MPFEIPNRRTENREEEVKNWELALMEENQIWRYQAYSATLSLKDDPTKRVYTVLYTRPRGTEIDIPLNDRTPHGVLAEQAYLQATQFGEVDQEKYRAYATDNDNRDQLFALLNREVAHVEPKEVARWFYRTFGVEHLQSYHDVLLYSNGGLGDYGEFFNATIQSRSIEKRIKDMTKEAAAKFTHIVRHSLPHINVDPLPVDLYLQDLQSALKFLPQDWGK